MNLGAMLKMIEGYVDDVPIPADAVLWLNAAKDRMATEVRASFPDIAITSDLGDTFVFPAKYHEIPVLYAAAMYKAQDSSIREKDSFMAQFETGVRNFAENYDPPAQYRDDELTQQFTAVEGQTEFVVTKEGFHPKYGRPKVYRSGGMVANYADYHVWQNKFTLTVPATEGEKITVVWEVHSDYIYPPVIYPGW